MAIYAGNGHLRNHLCFELRSRYLLFQRVKIVGNLSCLGACKSVDIVRCIHRNYSKNRGENSPCSLHSNSLNDATSRRSWISADERYHISCSKKLSDVQIECSKGDRVDLIGVVPDFKFLLGGYDREFSFFDENDAFETNADDASEMDAASVGIAKHDAKAMAVKVLAARTLTKAELRKNLCKMKFPHHEVEEAIANLQDRGLLNDYMYAETFTRSRWSSLSWGPRRIKQALLKKGVSEADAEKAVNEVFQEDDSGANRDTFSGMSTIVIDHLIQQASKQWLRSQDVSLEKRKSRIIRWLRYRGFSWGITVFVLKKLESRFPP